MKRLQFKLNLYLLSTEKEILKEKIWIMVEISSCNIQICQNNLIHLAEPIKREDFLKGKDTRLRYKKENTIKQGSP